MDNHVKLYLFEHIEPRVAVLVLKKKVEAQAKTISQMEILASSFDR